MIDQQLQLISADEQTRTNSHTDTDPHASKGKGKGKGKGGGKATATSEKPCAFLKKFGRCKFGDRCYYKHEGVTKTPAANQTTSNTAPTTSTEVQLCQLWSRTGKCKFGDNCKFKHQADANQAATPKAKAKPNAKPKAKPKAAASADSSGNNTLVGAKASSVVVTAGAVVAMARAGREDALSSSGDGSSDDADLQSMAGEATTPEWSDVEQGNLLFVSQFIEC